MDFAVGTRGQPENKLFKAKWKRITVAQNNVEGQHPLESDPLSSRRRSEERDRERSQLSGEFGECRVPE